MMVNRLGLPVLLFFSFTSEIVLAAPDGCPDLTVGYTYVNFGKCYQFVNTERYWPEAQTHCQGQGGNLVTKQQLKEGVHTPKRVILDVVTRWNSTHDMITRYLEIHTAIYAALSQLKLIHMVDSAEKQTWIVDKLNALGFGKGGYWIGAHDRHGEGDYMWDSGVEFSYSNWNSGQPDNSCPIFCANTDCVLMRSDYGYRWYDYPCSSSLYHYAYICEFAHIPTTTTTTTTVATTTTTATTKTTLTTMTPPTIIFTASSTFPLTDLTSTQAATQTSTTAPNTTAPTTTTPKSSPTTSSTISTITQTTAIQTATLTPSPSTATPTTTTTVTRTTDPTTTPTGNSSSMPTTTSAINPTAPSTTQTAITTATSLSPKITTIQANITISTVANTPVVTQATTSVTIPTAMQTTARVTSTTARSTATPTPPPTTTTILSSIGPPTATTSPLTSIVAATANPMTTSSTTTKSTTTPAITSTSSPAINITSRQTTTPAATPPTKQTTKPTMKQSTIGKTTKIIGTKPGIQTTSGKPGKEGASRQTGERNGVTNNLAIIMGCVAGGIVLISIAVFVVVRRKKLSRKNLFTRLTSTRSFSPHPQYNNPIYDDVQVPAAHFNQLET